MHTHKHKAASCLQVHAYTPTYICTYITISNSNKITYTQFVQYTLTIVHIIQFVLLTIYIKCNTYVQDSLESDIGPAGPIKFLLHRGHTHVLPVGCLKVSQHRVAVHRVGESGHSFCNFLRVNVKSDSVFEVVSL